MIRRCSGPSELSLRLVRHGFLRLVVLLSLASACPMAVADCIQVTNGLVAWWPGDGNANDIVGTNNGTLQDGATASAPGLVGSAFSFDGTNAYVQIPDSPVLQPTNLTIEAWVRFDSLDSPASGTNISGTNIPPGRQYIVFKESRYDYFFTGFALTKTRVGSGDVFAFEVDLDDGTTNGQPVVLTSTNLIVINDWYHVAGVRGSNFLQLYLNGQLESQTNISFPQSYGDYPLYFGTTAQPTWDRKLAGKLDEVSLYSRALSSGEIAAIYAAGANGKCQTRIVVQPQGQTAVAGTGTNFTVAATGSGQLSYQWQCNGVNLSDGLYFSGATSSNLTANHVLWSPCHDSVYSVVVTSVAGSVTSTGATLTVTLPPPGSSVSFPDTNLEAAVRAALSKPTGALAVSNLWALTSLTACGQHVTNLSGMEYATNLMGLYLPWNGISDLAPLQCLNKLVQLGLYHNRISDLSPLATLTGLSNLNAGDNLIAAASVLSKLTGLTSLWLDGNAISNLTFLTNLTQLGSLALDRNNITDVSVMTNLTSLSSLALGGNPGLTNYTLLSSLTNLASLSLRQGPIEDLSVLGGLTRLTSLDLYDAYRLRNLSPLTALSNLSRLDLSLDSSITNCSVLAGSTSLTNLYLRGISITNVAFLTNLYRLGFLNLDSTAITNASPVAGLTNLTYLTMTGNPKITNFDALSNLTGLVNLELRANSISNVAFMSGLSRLRYADLAYNSITSISPLAGLANLDSLVLAGNPTNDYSALSASASLTNLWLFDNAIRDVSFVTNFSRLSYLNLERNHITDISPLAALTNLTGLGLGGNSITDYGVLAGFTGLTSLRLGKASLGDGNTTFLTNLAQLTFLSLEHNRIANLVPLEGLRKLNDLYLYRNCISNIDTLESLPRLLDVDVRQNMLDVSSNSASWKVVQGLLHKGVEVESEPQNSAPYFSSLYLNGTRLFYLPTRKRHVGYITANTDGALTAGTWEDPAPDDEELVVTAVSLSPDLVSVPNNPVPGTNYSRTLTLTPSNPTDQTATITLTVTDDVLLSGSTNVELTVMPNTNVFNACANADPNLAVSISSWLGKPAGEVTPADLLMLDNLSIWEASVSDSCVWQWLTNLTTLLLDGNSVSNLDALTNLTHLSSLTLKDVGVTDFSPLAELGSLTNLSLYGASTSNLNTLTKLTQLTFLSVYGASVTDFSPLCRLTNLASLALSGPSIRDVNFLTNLTQLTSLSLYKTAVPDLRSLAGLTNLQSLYLRQNRLTNILSLTNLSLLSYVDLSLNLLDLNSGSSAARTVLALADRGVWVSYLPQRQPPAVTMSSNWVVAANTASWLFFRVSDNAQASDLAVSASALNTNLIPSANLVSGRIGDGSGIDWFLKVTPASNQVGTTAVTLTATNDAGLSTTASTTVTVDTPLPLDGPIFPDPNLTNWVTDGQASWYGQTTVSHEGVAAAQSGSISDNGHSRLEADVIGPGRLTFWWKVSSETNGGGGVGDGLEFCIDGTNELARIAGEVDWLKQFYNIPGGSHTLLWDYSKDYAASRGMDAGWVSQVSFVPGSWLQVAGPPTNGQCKLDLYLEPGKLYEVLASTNLVNWFRLAVVAGTNSAMPLTDTNAATVARFYCLRELPPPPWLELVGGPTNGQCQLVLYVEAGKLYEIQASTNRVNWFRVAVVAGTNSVQPFVDTTAGASPRYYRLRELPSPPWLELVGGPTHGQSHLELYLEPGKLYEVLASTNLVNWFRLATVARTNTVQPFIDAAAWSDARFYRLHDVSIWIEQPSLAPDGSVHLVLHSAPGLSFAIQDSTNLANWSEITLISNTPGTVQYTDALATNSPLRFYRAVLR